MKKVILILAIAAMGVTAGAQSVKESDVPSSVKTAFSSKYPGTTVDKWEKDNGNYDAKIKDGGVAKCVVIDSKGNWVKTKTHIDASALPQNVTDYVSKNYSGKKISEAWKVNKASGEISYDAEVSGNVLCFDSNGNYLKSEKKHS